MRRRIVLVALVVSGLGCNARIFNWKTQDEDFSAAESETTVTPETDGTSTGTSETSSTGDTTSGLTGTGTQGETTATSTETGTLTDTTAETTDTTGMTTGSSCGNEVCDPGESYADCPGDCPAECGNGMQEGDEACDDGNTDDMDACVQGCKTAVCGDGFVQTDVEECDDMNVVDTDACRNDCKLPRRVVFVTKDVFQGNMRKMGVMVGDTGLVGANAQCNASAAAAGLGGPFKAWLSDGTNNPAVVFDASQTNFAGLYVLVDGTKVADGWMDLTDGTLDHAIDKTEENIVVPDVSPWSNTAIDGMGLFQKNQCCTDWTMNMGGMGPIGHAAAAVLDDEWTVYGQQPCSGYAPLYCIEDHP